MVTYIALRTIHGDYGTKGPGETFQVPDHQAKKMAVLEGRGVIMRFVPRPRVDRKAYTLYENKAIQPPLNKRK